MVRQYIGARYVTKIYENSNDPSSAEWEASVNYEPLTLVTYNNGSYLSKKEVPANVGNPAANPLYWVQTGFYNGQIQLLEKEIDYLYFNTVSDMVNADLTTGEVTRTLGYHSINDGGGALYVIEDTPDIFSIALNNGRYATIIIENEMNFNQFGAYGDDTHDDSTVINTVLSNTIDANLHEVCTLSTLSGHIYLLNSPITIKGFGRHIDFLGRLDYTGNQHAVLIEGPCAYGYIRFEEIESAGGGIKFSSNDNADPVTALNVEMTGILHASGGNGIDVISTSSGWVTELHIYGGAISKAVDGLYVSGARCNGIRVHDMTFEGTGTITNGIHLVNTSNVMLVAPRYNEGFDNKFIILENSRNVTVFGCNSIDKSMISLDASSAKFRMISDISSSFIDEASEIVDERRYFDTNFPTIAFTSGDDLNDFYYVGVYSASSSAIANSISNKPTTDVDVPFMIRNESLLGYPFAEAPYGRYVKQTYISKNYETYVRYAYHINGTITWSAWRKVIESLTATVTGTTDANGLIALGIPDTAKLLSVQSNTPYLGVAAAGRTGSGAHVVKIMDIYNNTYSAVSVDLTVIYIV